MVTNIHIAIELARKKMIESVMQFGFNDKKTILLSQELDHLILYYQNEQIRSCLKGSGKIWYLERLLINAQLALDFHKKNV